MPLVGLVPLVPLGVKVPLEPLGVEVPLVPLGVKVPLVRLETQEPLVGLLEVLRGLKVTEGMLVHLEQQELQELKGKQERLDQSDILVARNSI